MSTHLRLVEAGLAPGFCGIVGEHQTMRELFDAIARAAPLDVPVLIEGATGTGKELVARALHELSEREGGFVAVNVAALADTLAESELFGAAKGAYTGATADRKGVIESAAGGTLLLDEAGDISLAMQAKLLRVLETGMVRPVGAVADRRVRFRLVATVQQPAERLVDAGQWRPDFYFRVAGITLRLPPLAKRASDVPLLVDHFLRELTGHAAEPWDATILMSHPWPGNVRQLRRAIERAVFESARGDVTAERILRAAQWIQPGSLARAASGAAGSLREAQIRHIESVLRETGYDVRAAARVLGLSGSQLYRKLRALAIPLPTRG